MLPKFSNPHSLTHNYQVVTRAEHLEDTRITSTLVHDGKTDTLKDQLEDLLRDTWGDTLGQTDSPRPKKRPRTHERSEATNPLLFRLLSSLKDPQPISLEPMPLPAPRTREPDCEDDARQAEERTIRARSVAVEFPCQWDTLGPQAEHKRDVIERKVLAAGCSFPDPLPTLMVTEEVRAATTAPGLVRKMKSDSSQVLAKSPHEPRATCTVLTIQSAVKRDRMYRRRRKQMTERPLPAYWRPPPGLKGKCMGYALGYPGSCP